MSQKKSDNSEDVQMLPQGQKMSELDPLINTHSGTIPHNQASAVNRNLSESSFQPSPWSIEYVLESLVRPCAAEFIAVAMFVFIGTTAACSGASIEGVAFAHGLTIALLVIATGSISGGQLNPAVTLGIFIGGAIGPIEAGLYVASQLMGSILGASFALGVIGSKDYDTHNGGGHVLPDNTTPEEAVLGEILLTYLLVTTVLLAAVDSSTKSSIGPLAIGFAVVVDILAGGKVTGASMNPARSFGPAVVVNKSEVWDYHWIYWVGPLIGSSIAGVLYRLLLAGPDKRILTRFTFRN